MAEGGEGEQDDVSFLRTVRQNHEKCPAFLSVMQNETLLINFSMVKCRKTWFVFRALEPENVSVSQLKDLEIDIVFLKVLLTG